MTATNRITNGKDASTAVPWQVSIRYGENAGWMHNCGGTILDEKTVLTAAHCFYPRKPEHFKVTKYFRHSFKKELFYTRMAVFYAFWQNTHTLHRVIL